MKELMEYREKLVSRWWAATEEFCAACRSFPDAHTKTNGEWTVHQIAFHVAGIYHEVYGNRILRTLQEEVPTFTNFEPEEWMSANYAKDASMENILNDFSKRIKEMCDQLGNAPQEIWSRLSCHESLGKDLTLQLWAERGLAHIEEHLKELNALQNK